MSITEGRETPVEKKIVAITRKPGRPPGAEGRGDKSLSRGNLTIRFDAEVKADLEFLKTYYRQIDFAPIIRMAIAHLARLARAQEGGKTL
jgi:hypothetical protein